jgi:hypothetical protein
MDILGRAFVSESCMHEVRNVATHLASHSPQVQLVILLYRRQYLILCKHLIVIAMIRCGSLAADVFTMYLGCEWHVVSL